MKKLSNSQGDVTTFPKRQQAIDSAVWMNFVYRTQNVKFGVFALNEDQWSVCDKETCEMLGVHFSEVLPKDYGDMNYEHIFTIATSIEPLSHWSHIRGMVSVMGGELLRFILRHNVPLEKFIRSELAARGFDEDHVWCGFEKTKEIWLKE